MVSVEDNMSGERSEVMECESVIIYHLGKFHYSVRFTDSQRSEYLSKRQELLSGRME